MPNSTLMVLAMIAIGVLLLAGPRLFRQLMASIRLTRALADNARAAAVPIGRYAAFDARFGALSPSDVIDERTWDDLYLDAVFRDMDHTISQPGRQYLYHLLRRPRLSGDTLSAFDARVRAFDRDSDAATRIRATLARLGEHRAADLEAVFFGDLPARPAFWWVFPLLTLSALGCLIGGLVWPGLIVVWVGVCALNTIAQMLYRPRVQEFVPAMRELTSFMKVARVLGGLDLPEFAPELAQLRDGASRLRPIRRATAWLRFEALGSNEIVGTLYEFANLLFVLDLTAFVLTTSHLRAQKAVTQQMFTALGTIDALQSIARWRATLDRWAVPEFTAGGKAMQAAELSHPMVPEAVTNDLAVQGTSVLITGSNMSGKTTFVRALGANAVLAQSVATTCATMWRAPVLRVRTSIGQADSLLEGKSYYLAEVESVRRMLVAKETGVQHLFLLDELFRGTNTSERVAAGYATLAWLNRGDDLVVVATHDVELHGLLGETWAAYHFREQVQDGTLTFDYRVQPGLSSTRNAIALLEVMRFPADLVADARAALGHRAESGDGR